MKYIKHFFEELNPDAYKNAGDKLKTMGQIKRGDNLINYSNSFKDKYRLNLFTKKIFKEYKENNPVITKEVDAYYHHHTIEYGDTGESLVDALDNKFNDWNDNYIAIKLFFDYNNTIIELGHFVILIYNDEEDVKNDNFRFSLSYELPYEAQVIYNGYESCGALAADKRSGYLLKKKLISILLDDVNIADIISLNGGTSSQFENFTKDVNNINTNLLISEIDKNYFDLF